MLSKLRARFADWRQRRHARRHPEPHRDRLRPQKRKVADSGGKPPHLFG